MVTLMLGQPSILSKGGGGIEIPLSIDANYKTKDKQLAEMPVGWKCRLKWRLATFFWFEEKLGQSIILKFVICYMYD